MGLLITVLYQILYTGEARDRNCCRSLNILEAHKFLISLKVQGKLDALNFSILNL